MRRERRGLVLAAAVVALLAFAGAATAEGKFSAWNQGNLYLVNIVDGGEPTFGWGPDWNNTTGIDQEWTFSYAGKDYGFSGTIEFGMSDITNNASVYDLGWFSTYYKFGSLAKLSLGRLRIEDYGFGSAVEGLRVGRLADKQFGAALQLFPLPGLSLGVFLQVPTASVYSRTFLGNAWQQIATAQPVDYLNNLAAGATFALPGNRGVVALQYSHITRAASVGLRGPLAPRVPFLAEYQIDLSDLGALSHRGFASLGLRLGDLGADADLAVSFDGETLALGAELKAEYGLGSGYAAGLFLGYDDGEGACLFNQGLGTWDGLELQPYVARYFDNGSSIRLSFLFASGANGHDSLVSVPLVYVWCF